MMHSAPTRRGPLAAAVVVLVILSFLIGRWGAWMGGLRGPAFLIVAPVQAPVYRFVKWLRPAESSKPEGLAALEREIERWKGLYLNQVAENDELKRKFDQFGKGALHSTLPTRQIERPVIGTPAQPGGQLTVRAGSREGVEVNSVATTGGVQLVGKVTLVDSRICTVRLITDISAGDIDGIIMTSDIARGPQCRRLHPVTDRKLQGRVRVGPTEQAPEAGQLVRLDDASWPRNAQMLVIGAIEKVEVDSFGWHIVTVKPTTDLERLSEVILRITSADEGDARSKPPGSTDGGPP